ncbi:MAG TPA: HlyD family efflux transporter periplasmic adaptor subunit [Dyella sp.]|uniref:efflux RND transporter periplasmic adaptor subunit n=1 Tax=Dyella sp. TaxID=1869338 RepID=UPI002D798F78|nr:HlyD family efflux transporter periplasmic adaptor subunit [Dyella sp.]HET6555391.1 HlyD family efflux transporter periplasmic adaptor subunit [Dyella sp.]
MTEALPPSALLMLLASLRDRALAADTLNALAFSIANDTFPLLSFRQALVFAQRGTGFELLCVSGLAKPTEDSPYLVWLRPASRWIGEQVADDQPAWLARDACQPPDDIADGWTEWWPAGAWCLPVHSKHGERLGLVVYLLDAAPDDRLPSLLQGLRSTWAYAWTALTGRQKRPRWRPTRRQLAVLGAIVALLLFLPVRQTALAPAEVVSRQAEIISSPIDGVIARMDVRPNQPVKAGTPLFQLDETTLRSRADVLQKEAAVADAELVAATQRSFDNPQSKNELTLLDARLQERRAELDGVRAQLERTRVMSPRAGVAVYSDPNDWIGKPVVTGERILRVADPAVPAMQIELPVADAIALEPGSQVTLYLAAYPLQPLHGTIIETSYEARPNDDGIVAYRLLASVDGSPAHARLGLHGTAKLYGGRVLLGYYLFRRPLAAFRAWTGL